MKKMLVLAMCAALAVTLAACGKSSSEETAETEEETVETEEADAGEEEEASEEPELVTTDFMGMTFSYPAGCEYTEDEDSATITLEQGTIAATILVRDLSDMGDLADAYVAMAPSNMLSAYDNVTNREDYDTTLGGLDAKGATAIVEMDGVWGSYLVLCPYDPDTFLLYYVAVMERSGAEHTDYVDLFIDSISFGKEDTATDEVATDETANEEPAEEAEAVPSDYQSALKQAESYSSRMHMSKQGIFDQLTSDYGGQFSDEAAQYAIDNVNADWNANALASAESYSNNMHMSKQGVYDQLTSEHGEQFTADEAQYAVDNMEADWNANALEKAKSYRDNMNMSPDRIREQLTSEYGEKFTEEEADYAIANLG